MEKKRRIGIVGLGIMGQGIADNFLNKGHEVFVWNRTASVAEEFSKKGAAPCKTPGQVCENSEIVFEVTADDSSSRQVWLSEEGILSKALPEKFLVASATLSCEWTDELAKICKERNLRFLDIPLTGGRIGAETGTLTLLCGGEEKDLDAIRGDLAAISKQVKHFGKAGQGMRYKLILNFLQAVHVVGFSEAMKIAKGAGMDLGKVADALAERPGGIPTEVAKRAYFSRPDPITFSVEWLTKDLKYARKLAGEEGPTLLSQVLSTYEAACLKGFSKRDWAEIGKF